MGNNNRRHRMISGNFQIVSKSNSKNLIANDTSSDNVRASSGCI